MNLIIYKLLAALLIFLVSIASIARPLLKKKILEHNESQELGEAFASGGFLGAAFFHMLPDSIRLFGELFPHFSFPLSELICVFGFLILLFLERISFRDAKSSNTVPYVLVVILVIHALTEGAALGISNTLSETLILALAIMAHKGSESYALCITMLRYELPIKRVALIILLFALMTPIGISLGTTISAYTLARSGMFATAILSAFAAGTFLYISTLHHIHFHTHAKDSQGLIELGSLIIGVMLMGLIAVWA